MQETNLLGPPSAPKKVSPTICGQINGAEGSSTARPTILKLLSLQPDIVGPDLGGSIPAIIILRTGCEDIESEVLKALVKVVVLLGVCHYDARLFDQFFGLMKERPFFNVVVMIQNLVEVLAIAQEIGCVWCGRLDGSTLILD